jgi:hypothetical protein
LPKAGVSLILKEVCMQYFRNTLDGVIEDMKKYAIGKEFYLLENNKIIKKTVDGVKVLNTYGSLYEISIKLGYLSNGDTHRWKEPNELFETSEDLLVNMVERSK